MGLKERTSVADSITNCIMNKVRPTHQIINDINYRLLDNEYDQEVMPHYGLVPDWKPRYDQLATLVRELIKSQARDTYIP